MTKQMMRDRFISKYDDIAYMLNFKMVPIQNEYEVARWTRKDRDDVYLALCDDVPDGDGYTYTVNTGIGIDNTIAGCPEDYEDLSWWIQRFHNVVIK